MKVLFKVKPESEQYRRFVGEIEVLCRLNGTEGVLSLLDFDLPAPTAEIPRPWFVMPVAIGITDALSAEQAGPERVIEAIAEVAGTLARLHACDVAHRDIKPENLYYYNGSWAVGDFGLAEFPGQPLLTGNERWLGPLHFLAPEMLAHPANAAGAPADVYSLAKTLWVLATGQRWPPPGELRVEVPQLALSSYADHDRIRLLVGLLERMTRHDPVGRPTMAKVHEELRAWLE